MDLRKFAFAAGLAAVVLAPIGFAAADDDKPGPAVKNESRVLVFPDGGARFYVTHDKEGGSMTFRLADPKMQITSAPVVTLKSGTTSRPVTLTAVPGETATWRLTNPALRADAFDGSMRIVVAGKTYDAPLVLTTDVGNVPGPIVEPAGPVVESKIVARHGGRVIAFKDCPAHLEVVQNVETGTLMLYPLEDTTIVEPPVVTVTATTSPAPNLVVTKSGDAWMVKDPVFKTSTVDGRVRIVMKDSPCEAPLAVGRGGTIVSVAGGPRFEVVRDEKARAYTFYALDEQIDGRPVVIENPQVVYTTDAGPRTYTLTRVEGEPRAWRLVGFDAGASHGDARLGFTLFGKTLSTNVGLSGFGVNIR